MKNLEFKKHNLIVIAADQLRYDVLGLGVTPNLDQLMEESVVFDRAYCASPLCVPARGALFTGTYPGKNGSLINGWFKPEKQYAKVRADIDNLYEIMERLDMECIHSGKQHLFMEGEPLEKRPESKTRWLTTEQTYKEFLKQQGKRHPGGNRFRTQIPEMYDGAYTYVRSYSNASTGIYEEGCSYYYDGYFTDRSVEVLEELVIDKPLFLSMMHLAPHPPFDVPEPWYSKVRKEDVQLPENTGVWYPHQSPLQKYNLTGVIGNQYSTDDWKETFRVYLGLVALLDDCVGRVIDVLKRKGLYDNSIIIFTSDHGDMLGAHRLFQKMCMYEESVRTPLSIRIPGGINGGRHIKTPISHIDLLPTICDFYSLSPRHKMDGRSLKALLNSDEELDELPVFIQYDGNASRGNFSRCVIEGKDKLIVDLFKDETYLELYDLDRDVLESDNLVFQETYDRRVKELLALLTEHEKKLGDGVRIPEVDLAKFRDLYHFACARPF